MLCYLNFLAIDQAKNHIFESAGRLLTGSPFPGSTISVFAIPTVHHWD